MKVIIDKVVQCDSWTDIHVTRSVVHVPIPRRFPDQVIFRSFFQQFWLVNKSYKYVNKNRRQENSISFFLNACTFSFFYYRTVDAQAYVTCLYFRGKKNKKLKNDAKINGSAKTLLHKLSISGYGLLMYLSYFSSALKWRAGWTGLKVENSLQLITVTSDAGSRTSHLPELRTCLALGC